MLYAAENGGALPGSGGTKDGVQFKADVALYLYELTKGLGASAGKNS